MTELLCNGGAMAFALTEAESGSDSAGMRTTYVDDGDAYVINGSKTFISGGEHADMFLVFATFDRELRGKGVSAFYVDAKTPGLSIGKKEDKMGYRTSDTVDLIFDNVRVPKDMLIGKECVVTEAIDNVLGTGAVTVGGKVWTARTEEPDGKAETGKVMTVVKIEGVKLIVK